MKWHYLKGRNQSADPKAVIITNVNEGGYTNHNLLRVLERAGL
jgi:hypothetical protein